MFETGYVVAGIDSIAVEAHFADAAARFRKEMGPAATLCNAEGRVDGFRWLVGEYGVNVTQSKAGARVAVVYSVLHSIKEPLCSKSSESSESSQPVIPA